MEDVNRKGEMAMEGTHEHRETQSCCPPRSVRPTRSARSSPPGWRLLMLAAARNTRSRACRPEEGNSSHQVSISVLHDTMLLVG